ncbi:23S rRNA (pseudouridine(1915)-N(3))-methyltransferase RlmH [Brumimicrobium salinarum]|uniref:Ribosomal RNA large subunit methyltransferase H n=1 Tax=Brumimicrobium salinarum TaxID=2058658 RepID=A0A2I0R169_9FLAO|nr:23S rRNA (pseudouridine(1915)-N(3))-methyltransferase RlmH [Brumimicrobium salinarum]PKR80317.1 23S rRNA (pseudouridine(1915)-N(3))-methyltransferase RlmH [Brumimicrobium salinarum]
MKSKLIYVGKTGKSFLKEGEKEYFKRLNRYIPFEIIEINDVKNAKKRSEEEIKQIEGEQILKKLKGNDFLILLDEKGKEFTSINFSKYIQKQFNAGHQNLTFVIGGPYGFSNEVYKRANDNIALSKLTFSHQMIRMFFLEQMYRAMTILKNEPYHHQ